LCGAVDVYVHLDAALKVVVGGVILQEQAAAAHVEYGNRAVAGYTVGYEHAFAAGAVIFNVLYT
jgi:hypothetical protein